MTDDEFHETWTVITSLARMASLAPIEDVQALLATVSRAHAVGWVLDPTAYRAGTRNLDEQETLANGFLAFLKAIEQVKAGKR